MTGVYPQPSPRSAANMEQQLDTFTGFKPHGATLEDLTRPVLVMLESALGLESTYLTAIDEERGIQSVLFSRNSQQLQIPEGQSFGWGDTLCRRALEEGESWVPDVPEHWAESEAAESLGIVTYVSCPIFAGEGELVGTLCGASRQAVPPDRRAMNVLSLFASMIGQRIDQEHQIDRLKFENRELAAQAMVDALTGLPNRRALEAELKRELYRATRSATHIAVSFIDLDGFKAINDTHGHEAGDEFLAQIGQRLAFGLRAGDFAARIGGDEFIVISPNASYDSATGLAARIDELLKGQYQLNAGPLHYEGASIGVVIAGAGHDSSEVIRAADAAMYEVKKQRRTTRQGQLEIAV